MQTSIKGTLWTGFVGQQDANLYVIAYDGANWGDRITVGEGLQTNGVSPALAVWEGDLWMGYVGQGGNDLYVISYDGANWGSPVQVGGGAQTNSVSPALAVFQGDLWVGYVGQNGNNLYVISYDGTNWGKQVPVGGGAQTNNVAPALAVWDDSLWVGYVGEGGSNMYVIAYDGTSRWGSQSQLGDGAQTNNTAMGLASWAPSGQDSQLWAGYTGKSDNNMYVISYGGKYWSKQVQVGGSAQTNGMAPALTTWGTQPSASNDLWVGYTGKNGSNLYVINYDGSGWGKQNELPENQAQTGNIAPALAAL